MDRTQYRINLEYGGSVRAEMLAIAKKFLEERLGLVQTARELLQFRDGVDPEIGTLLDVFVGIDSATDALPIGTERALWNLQALEVEDRKIAAAELQWHGRATEAARRLVGLLETCP